jgi:hypothetical protein
LVSEFFKEETSLFTASFLNLGKVEIRLEIEEAYTMASGVRYAYVSDKLSECNSSEAAELVEQESERLMINITAKSLYKLFIFSAFFDTGLG